MPGDPGGRPIPGDDKSGDWVKPRADNRQALHEGECKKLFAANGHPDQCVLVAASHQPTLAHAAMFCECSHAVDAPQHSLYSDGNKQAIFDKMVSGTHYRTDAVDRRARSGNRDSGGGGGGKGGGGRGRGSFRGRPARGR